MKKIFPLIAISLLLCSCGHNILTDYEVKGLDLSFPVGGYPVGLRIGIVRMNSNVVRGNSSYNVQSDSSATGNTIQNAKVIQFSANTQLNERNIVAIATDKDVDPETKHLIIDNATKNTKAPELPDASIKTPSTTSAISDDPKIHKSEDFKDVKPAKPSSYTVFHGIFDSIVIKNIVNAFCSFFFSTLVGRILVIVLKSIVYFLVALIVIKILKSIFMAIKCKIKRSKNEVNQ